MILLLMPFLFNSFITKWTLPHGTYGSYGRMVLMDTNHDGISELIFNCAYPPYNMCVYYYQLHMPGGWWDYDTLRLFHSTNVWDGDDYDQDGLSNLLVDGYVPIDSPFTHIVTVLEAPDSLSYPSQVIWQDTVDGFVVSPGSSYDINSDGFIEPIYDGGIATPNFYEIFNVYKYIGDNHFQSIFAPADSYSVISTIAFGDFDGDTNCEMVLGSDVCHIYEYEPSRDTIIEKRRWWPSVYNVRDCCTIPNADGDGKLEFMIKGFNVDGFVRVWIYKALGNDIYSIIDSFDFDTGYWQYAGGYSDAGDVDADGRPEVAVEAPHYIRILKAAGTDSFYVWDSLPANEPTGSCVRITNDLDHNGINEIIISGGNMTKIYEYSPGGVGEKNTIMPINCGIQFSAYPNLVRNNCMIEYTLTHSTIVHLVLYDATGRLVKTLENGHMDTGVYRHSIKLHDLSPGIYFLQLTTETGSSVRKVIRMK